MAVLELVMNFFPTNMPAVPATLVFVVLIKYLACSTFPFPKAKRWICQKFHWDLPTAFLSSNTSVCSSDVQVKLLGMQLWELEVMSGNFPLYLRDIQSHHSSEHDEAKESGKRPNTQALLMYSIYWLIPRYLFLDVLLQLVRHKNSWRPWSNLPILPTFTDSLREW